MAPLSRARLVSVRSWFLSFRSGCLRQKFGPRPSTFWVWTRPRAHWSKKKRRYLLKFATLCVFQSQHIAWTGQCRASFAEFEPKQKDAHRPRTKCLRRAFLKLGHPDETALRAPVRLATPSRSFRPLIQHNDFVFVVCGSTDWSVARSAVEHEVWRRPHRRETPLRGTSFLCTCTMIPSSHDVPLACFWPWSDSAWHMCKSFASLPLGAHSTYLVSSRPWYAGSQAASNELS